LKNFLSNYLPDYMIPENIIILDTLPLTENGKLDSKALLKLDADSLKINSYQPRRNIKEKNMCEIWAEIFGLSSDKIGIHNSFFELGGHSILAIRLVHKINQTMNVTLNVATIFRYNTIDKLMTHIDSSNKKVVGEKYVF